MGTTETALVSLTEAADTTLKSDNEHDSETFAFPAKGQESLKFTTEEVLKGLAYAVHNLNKTYFAWRLPEKDGFASMGASGPKPYGLAIGLDNWTTLNRTDQLFRVLHELLHAAVMKCGHPFPGQHHRSTAFKKSHMQYQSFVLTIFKRLRSDGAGEYSRVSDKEMDRLEGMWGEKKKP